MITQSKDVRNYEALVREFHEKFGLGYGGKPVLGYPEEQALRMDLLFEELSELTTALLQRDIVETADALADLVYYAIGMAVLWGIPFDEVFREVHASNMSKLDEDGQPIYRADGKVLKGPNYREPDILSIIARRRNGRR
jgi:predicted HAD superfamily Cof-like phosphohydrolase